MSEQRKVNASNDAVARGLRLVSTVAIVGLTVIVVALFVAQYLMGIQSQAAAALAEHVDIDPEAVLLRAQDAVNTVQLLLSFLEGAAVLAGLAVGAAAFYGFRSSDETRQELEAEIEKIEGEIRKTETLRTEVQATKQELDVYRPALQNLAQLREEVDESQRSLRSTIGDVGWLLQADQEFRLKNYDTAYDFAQRVLEHNPENPMALYIAGWLEVHHVWDRLDAGIAHLKKITTLGYDWPTARAAYGVGVRRKAKRATGAEQDRLFLEARGVLEQALAASQSLLDFNGESFWGPVGGIWRDVGNVDEAIKAYENALRVTPGSSYPMGNLAALLLQKARRDGDRTLYERALDIFTRTDAAARAEMASKPNDYYLLMDIAMASLMQGEREARRFREGHDRLHDALRLDVSLTALETSRRGWQHLLANCPDEWTAVRTELERALTTVDEAMRRATESAAQSA